MAKGKVAESEALKNAVKVYEALSDSDKVFFKNKLFAKICNGLSKADRDSFKKERLEFLARIEKAKESAKQLEAVSALSIEELERILEAKKKNQ